MFLLKPIIKICVHVKCYTATLAHQHLLPPHKLRGSLKTSGYLPVGLKFSSWPPFRWLIMSSALRDPAAPCEYMNHMKHLIHVYFDSVKHLSGHLLQKDLTQSNRSVPSHNLGSRWPSSLRWPSEHWGSWLGQTHYGYSYRINQRKKTKHASVWPQKEGIS